MRIPSTTRDRDDNSQMTCGCSRPVLARLIIDSRHCIPSAGEDIARAKGGIEDIHTFQAGRPELYGVETASTDNGYPGIQDFMEVKYTWLVSQV